MEFMILQGKNTFQNCTADADFYDDMSKRVLYEKPNI